jgi:hypothetical protein
MKASEIRPGDKALEAALEKVRTTPGESEKFAADPEGYLKSKGVATAGLKIAATQGELNDQTLDAVSGGAGGAQNITICASVGAVFCASVG